MRSDDELGDGLFAHSFGVWSVPVCRSVEDPRGARHWGRIFVPYAVGLFDPDCDAVIASAAKHRAADPFYRSASGALFEYGFPPPRIVDSAVMLKSQRERRMVLSAIARSGKPFQAAGRKTTPSN